MYRFLRTLDRQIVTVVISRVSFIIGLPLVSIKCVLLRTVVKLVNACCSQIPHLPKITLTPFCLSFIECKGTHIIIHMWNLENCI